MMTMRRAVATRFCPFALRYLVQVALWFGRITLSAAALSVPSNAASTEDDLIEMTAKYRVATVRLELIDLADQDAKYILRNYADEAVQCLVFYQTLAAAGWVSEDKTKTVEDSALVLYMEAQSFMEKDVLDALVHLTSDNFMHDRLRGDSGRIPVLAAEYGRPCKEHMEEPKKRIQHWRKSLGY